MPSIRALERGFAHLVTPLGPSSHVGSDAKRRAENKGALARFFDVVEAARHDQNHFFNRVVDVRFGNAQAAQETPKRVEMALDDAAQAHSVHARQAGIR